jgi:hypothetical protein
MYVIYGVETLTTQSQLLVLLLLALMHAVQRRRIDLLWHVNPLFHHSASKFRYCCRLNGPVIYPPCARMTVNSRQKKMFHLKTGLYPIVDVINEDNVMHIQTVDVFDAA